MHSHMPVGTSCCQTGLRPHSSCSLGAVRSSHSNLAPVGQAPSKRAGCRGALLRPELHQARREMLSFGLEAPQCLVQRRIRNAPAPRRAVSMLLLLVGGALRVGLPLKVNGHRSPVRREQYRQRRRRRRRVLDPTVRHVAGEIAVLQLNLLQFCFVSRGFVVSRGWSRPCASASRF